MATDDALPSKQEQFGKTDIAARNAFIDAQVLQRYGLCDSAHCRETRWHGDCLSP